MNSTDNSILKFYASSTDKIGFNLLYEHLVVAAKQKGIAGVTVYRGIMGYGPSTKKINSTRFWELTEKLPVVIEMIDNTVILEEFYHFIEDELKSLLKGCLITLQPLEILLHKTGTSNQLTDK